MTSKHRSSLAVIALMCSGLSHAPAFGASLEDTIRSVLKTNPDIGVVRADRQAIDQELNQARAEFLPSVDLRGALGPEYTNSPATRNRGTRGPDGDASTTRMRYESQITLTQSIFDGFGRRSEVDRQKARIDSAAYRVGEASEFIALDGVEAHLDILRNQELVELARENVAAHQRILAQVSLLESEGAGSLADLVQTESRLGDAYNNLAISIGNLNDAEALYISVVGEPPADLELPTAPAYALPESADAAAALATTTNPTVQITGADIGVAEAELRGSQAAYYPTLDMELAAAANDNLDGVRGGDVSAQALLVLRYNLFRGGGDIAREREAFARIGEARETRRQAQRGAEEEGRVAFNALITARAQLEALRQVVAAQRSTRDVYAQQFDLGQRGLLDVLDAENELFVDRSNLTTATYTEVFSVYRVLAVIGDLLSTLDIDRAPETVSIYREPQPSID